MARYTDARYPEKVNDIIDNEGKIKAEALPGSAVPTIDYKLEKVYIYSDNLDHLYIKVNFPIGTVVQLLSIQNNDIWPFHLFARLHEDEDWPGHFYYLTDVNGQGIYKGPNCAVTMEKNYIIWDMGEYYEEDVEDMKTFFEGAEIDTYMSQAYIGTIVDPGGGK